MFRHRSLLIAYASQLGHTRHIATWLADAFQRAGLETTVVDVTGPDGPDLRAFSTVVAVSSVHFDRPSRPMLRWLTKHSEALQAGSLEIVSVSLTAAMAGDEARQTVERYARPLAAAAGTEPVLCEHVGGALQYTQYGRLKRALVRRVAGSRGFPTDVTHDVDLTDWAQLEQFVVRSMELIDREPAAAGAAAKG